MINKIVILSKQLVLLNQFNTIITDENLSYYDMFKLIQRIIVEYNSLEIQRLNLEMKEDESNV